MISVKVEGDVEAVAEQMAAMSEVDYLVITVRARHPHEVVCEDDEHLRGGQRRVRAIGEATEPPSRARSRSAWGT